MMFTDFFLDKLKSRIDAWNLARYQADPATKMMCTVTITLDQVQNHAIGRMIPCYIQIRHKFRYASIALYDDRVESMSWKIKRGRHGKRTVVKSCTASGPCFTFDIRKPGFGEAHVDRMVDLLIPWLDEWAKDLTHVDESLWKKTLPEVEKNG